MILIDNRNVLRLKDRALLQKISQWDNRRPSGAVIVEKAKTGVPIVKILIEGKTQYLQSKYDPMSEAERFVDKFTKDSHHVLFIGIGMGYHINYFMKKHPETKFLIYEPNEEVLHAYLSNSLLNELPLQHLIGIFTGIDEKKIMVEIESIIIQFNEVLQIIPLPIYEKIYSEKVGNLLESTLKLVKDRHSIMLTNAVFQKRWTINSIKNFPVVLQTPNILHDIDSSAFKGKPAIIVAAGPSLNEEFENLRYIKKHGLAYIFSVGSAINALIEQGVYPDAACTYDPSERNQLVFKKLKDQQVDNIPLIFGSSVGFETLSDYPGEMLHMITSQDTVSPQLLDTAQSIDIVLDAPSIAVVTLQILIMLGTSPIILVGQNLGFQNDQRYAAGIQYDFVESKLNDEEKKKTLNIKDVQGNDIKTNDGFNWMRQQLEMHIASNPGLKVINTTKNGAHIEGTTFTPLEQLIGDVLADSIVLTGWHAKSNKYDVEFIESRAYLMNEYAEKMNREIQSALEELERIQKSADLKQYKNIEKRFASFDKQFNKIKKNEFYAGFIEPLMRVQNEKLSLDTKKIRYEENLQRKADTVVNSFGLFLHEIKLHFDFVLPYFQEMKTKIDKISEE
ncbi:motility associated factor glycosyltransferase family protein [Sporosarcina gallistercoris]|uniref:Motility associated factor glycosyltransferase family protein n=1 Tax=Sporosarcina gallistercoris TaxID=2762245 RepID=A0ABR8PNC1_9BACL|nr:6-hydroxymethylpterin diphosphokinase MptE-like protein [Sporosarcina gallistercoris]MBD7909610.1 motility associated factor glycosyltransferase family protein [Sporosarcina gallistercoris]